MIPNTEDEAVVAMGYIYDEEDLKKAEESPTPAEGVPIESASDK